MPSTCIEGATALATLFAPITAGRNSTLIVTPPAMHKVMNASASASTRIPVRDFFLFGFGMLTILNGRLYCVHSVSTMLTQCAQPARHAR